jgi:formiminotetrahydrofolate cyclodeaminase
MESIVKNIYSGKATYASVEALVDKCLSVDTNQSKFYDFINSLIRDEVEVFFLIVRLFVRK